MNIIMFGPNGSGKGTQSSLIRKEFGLSHIESGDIFREHVGRGTALGLKIKSFTDKGELVPDDITIPMILDVLKGHRESGWLLDGFPRNTVQAEKLWEALQVERFSLDFIVEIELEREEAKQRIMGRRICKTSSHHPNNVHIKAIHPVDEVCRVCKGKLTKRPDDQDERAIGTRHDIYYDGEAGTLAAVGFFKGLVAEGHSELIVLDGAGSIEDIKTTLLSKLKPS